MTTPAAAPPRTPALLLVGGPRGEVRTWASRTVVPLVSAPLAGWTVVVPDGPSHVEAPYDDAVLLAAARPLGARAAPGLGVWQIDERAVITVHPAGRRRQVRWVVWDPELGLLRPPGLDLAGPGEIAGLAGVPRVRDELVDLLHETQLSPRRLLTEVLHLLQLPGAELLVDPSAAHALPGAERHTPVQKQIGWFHDAVKDSVRLRRELGALP